MPNKEIAKQPDQVHGILAHSYLTYFFAVILGLILDLTLPIKIIPPAIASAVGIVFLLVAPALILWAQVTSSKFSKEKKQSDTLNFAKGPYTFSRSPTHLGLDILVIGFGLILNSLFVVVFSIISFFVTRLFFVKKEERILSKKYGSEYAKYQKTVRPVI